MPESWTHFDAIINWGNGKAYFFHGAEYARYDIALDTFDQPPRPIHTYWNGFPSEWSHIDAAVNWGEWKGLFVSREPVRCLRRVCRPCSFRKKNY